MPSSSRVLPLGLCVLTLAVSGCAARKGVFTSARATEAGMPCSEAARVARGALLKMGYTIAAVEPPQPGVPGRVVGHKTSGWTPRVPEAGEEFTAIVTIHCSDRGAEFEAVSDESFTARLGLRQRFPEAIAAVAERRVRRPRLDEAPQPGLHIAVDPQRGPRAQAAFGTDLPASGITPVRVKVENRTARTYGFRRAKVELVTQEGQRVAALPVADVAARFDGEVGARLVEEQIADGDVPPGATLAGYLYFPASAYRRATVVLIDRDSEEAEGFSVEF